MKLPVQTVLEGQDLVHPQTENILQEFMEVQNEAVYYMNNFPLQLLIETVLLGIFHLVIRGEMGSIQNGLVQYSPTSVVHDIPLVKMDRTVLEMVMTDL